MRSSRLSNVFTAIVPRNLFVARYSTEVLKTLEDVPGPPSWPIVGQLPNFMPLIGDMSNVKYSFDLMDTYYKRYGPIVRIGAVLHRPPMLFMFDPEDFEYVLHNEQVMPERAGFDSLKYFRENLKKDDYSPLSGLLTDQNEGWKKFRSMVNPVFLQPRTIKLYADSIDQVARDMVARLKRIRAEDNTIKGDIEIEMNKWALESIALVGLGGRIGCLEDDLPEDSTARQLIQCVRDCFEMMDELDFKLNPWRYITTPTFKKGMAVYEKQTRLSKYYINKAIEDMKQRKSEVEAKDKSILEKLLELDDKVALIMASDMLFAGVDTAAHTMMALLYHLAKNPEKQNKLREEIRAGVEKKYLKACVKENSRLTPVVGGNMRRLTKDLKIKNYLIPKGVDVVFAHQYISCQDSQYVRAKEYLPERWLVSKDDPLHYSSAHPMATLPFGHGTRSCIGRRIAELEVETFLARVIDSFSVEWNGPPPTIVTKALNYMQAPYYFVFNDAE